MKPALLLTALIFASTGVLHAQPGQPNRPGVIRGGHRFLILIEASKDMNRLADGVVETSLHLAETGFKGQARDGDAFALWPYRDRVAGHLFEPVIWNSARLKEQERVVETFVAPLKYEGLASSDLAVKELLEVAAASESATLILINPGEKPVSGTPFDTYIRNAYERDGRAIRREKLPVVTAFLASGGLIVDCVVSKGGTNVALPTLPENLRSRARVVVPPAVATNAPAPKKTPAAAPKKKADAPVAPLREPAAAEASAPPSLRMSLAPPPPRPLAAANDAAASAPPTTNPPPVAMVSAPPPSVPPPTDAAPPAPPPAPPPTSAALTAAELPGNTSVPAVAAPVVETSRGRSAALAFALIGAAVALAGVMIALLLRPARGTAISAAMESGAGGRKARPGGG